MKLKAGERKKLGNKLHAITTMYHDAIPLSAVSLILAEFDLVLLQEDYTLWSGFLCGREANTTFILGKKSSVNDQGVYEPIKDLLYFYWYRFDSTKRYEINMYLT